MTTKNDISEAETWQSGPLYLLLSPSPARLMAREEDGRGREQLHSANRAPLRCVEQFSHPTERVSQRRDSGDGGRLISAVDVFLRGGGGQT